MSETIAAIDNPASVMMRKFIQKIGQQDEALMWGVKTNPTIQAELVKTIGNHIDGKKAVGVKVLHEQAPMVGNRTPLLKSIMPRHIIFIPNADAWDQDTLIKVAFQASESGCKALLGFSEQSRLSMMVYQLLVSQQISDSYELSAWAVNMLIPIGDIR